MKDELQHVTQGEQLRGHDIVQVRDYKSSNYVGKAEGENHLDGKNGMRASKRHEEAAVY